jgi:hypothetical protein
MYEENTKKKLKNHPNLKNLSAEHIAYKVAQWTSFIAVTIVVWAEPVPAA